MGPSLFFRTDALLALRPTSTLSLGRGKKIGKLGAISRLLEDCIQEMSLVKQRPIQKRPRKVVKLESFLPQNEEKRGATPVLSSFYHVPPAPDTSSDAPKKQEKIEETLEIILSEVPPAPEGKKPKSEKLKETVPSGEGVVSDLSLKIPQLLVSENRTIGQQIEVLGVKDIVLSEQSSSFLEESSALEAAKKNLEEPVLEKGKVLSIFSNENAQCLFLALNESAGYSVKKALLFNAACGVTPDKCDVISLAKDSKIAEWPQKKTLQTVVFVVDNLGLDTKENAQIARLVSHFLAKNLITKIALPRAKGIDERCTFSELLEQPKGAGKCGRSFRGAVQIEHARDLEPLDEPLGNILQKLVEKRDRISVGASSKEPIEQRLSSAIGIYNKGEVFGSDNIVAVNLILRGITSPAPSNFRAALLMHPDGPEQENKKILESKDKREPLLTSLKTNPSLDGKVIAFGGKYWTVTSDLRWGDGQGDFLTTLSLKNCQEEIRVNVLANEVQIDGISLASAETAIQVCDFKLYTRVIPYFNESGELTGIERTFLGPDAKRPLVGKRRSKLARGITNGSSAILFGTKDPEIKVLGEGSENVLSALEVAKMFPKAAQSLGLNLETETCNCQFTAALGVSDLIKVPIEKSVKTIILIADIDGYNMETKQSLIDMSDAFLKRGLTLKIVFAIAEKLGKKRDFNDVLMEEGGASAEKILSSAVTIHSKRDLGAPNEPLQRSLYILMLKQRKQTPETLLALGRELADLGKLKEASVYYKKAFDHAEIKVKGELYHAIGSWCLEMKGPDQALIAYKKSVQYKIQHGLDPGGDEVLSSLEGMGRAYAEKKEFDLALSYFGKVFQQKVNYWKTDEHEGLASLFFEFGNVDFSQGNLTRALFNYQKASRLTQKEFGDKIHPKVATITEKIGDIYAQKQKHKDAIGYYKHAQEILQKVFCSDRHGLDEELSLKIADQYFLQNLFESSFEHYRKALPLTDQKSPSPVLKALLERARLLQLGVKAAQGPDDVNVKNIHFAHQYVPGPSLKNPSALTINLLRERSARVRQVVLDLEMTGLVPKNDRIIEIGCVALLNLKRTGEIFQTYINPECPVRPDAHRITGLTQGFLSKHPLFSEVVSDFLQFIEGSDLVIHGSSSDLQFLSQEFRRSGITYSIEERHKLIDTVNVAKMLFPGQKNSLDALNGRLNINHPRPKHGALLDAQITADVYLSMLSLQSLVKVKN